MTLGIIIFSLLTLSSATTTFAQELTPYENQLNRIVESKVPDSEKLERFFSTTWQYRLNEFPEFATQVGAPGHDDKWTDISLESFRRRDEELKATHEALLKIRRDKLTEAGQENYDLFLFDLRRDIRGIPFKEYLLPIDQLDGIQQTAPNILGSAPTRSAKDFENRIDRLKALPKRISQTIALMEEGLREGIATPKIVLKEVPVQVQSLIPQDPFKSPLLLSFSEIPKYIPKDIQNRLRAEAQRVYRDEVVPALQTLHDYLSTQYIPKCRESIGFSELPHGKEWYDFEVYALTTTSMTPEQIHELGLAEVKRIRTELEQVMREVHFKGSFKRFTHFLGTDPRFFFNKPEDLITAYRDIAKRIDPELPKLFGKLPRNTYGVKPVPSFMEKSQPAAYYEPGALQAGRAGYFFANTYKIKSRPKWEMEALTAHEAVPGHHFQVSLAQELDSVPDFRKTPEYNAYVEGWGLYSESLGAELGLYKDPYSHSGQLINEMWRSVRLVVDTGIHALGWSRSQAIQYFSANSSKNEHEVAVEVDRYMVWPGQALSYKIGELKFKELRKRAKAQLGDRFDIRAFHDVLLGSGALPLSLVEKKVDAWISARLK